MTLVAWGETHIDSSIAGIAQASVPIFVVLLSLRFLPHEPLGPTRVAGLALFREVSCSGFLHILVGSFFYWTEFIGGLVSRWLG